MVSENIKLYFFKKDGVDENIEHQEKVIFGIKEKLKTFLKVKKNKKIKDGKSI